MVERRLSTEWREIVLGKIIGLRKVLMIFSSRHFWGLYKSKYSVISVVVMLSTF